MVQRELVQTEEEALDCLGEVSHQVHEACFVCGSRNRDGLNLEFRSTEDGAVEACFDCDSRFEGYTGYVHGGIISSLLDGAMTNCLFALGKTPLTAELKVRFRHPLVIGEAATVRAWLVDQTARLYSMEAEVVQEDRIKARGWGKFLRRLS
jgi:uncharacterized protein (TIGR00369 family)